MSDKNSSWAHRILRHDFPTSATCTVPGCGKRPIFQVSAKTKGGGYTRAYCHEHGKNFAKKFGIAMPAKRVDDVQRINLKRWTTSALEFMLKRIQKELEARKSPQQDICFEFNEIGPDDKRKSPYVSRLRWDRKTEDIGRYYFPGAVIKKELPGEGKVQVKGSYCVRPGSIVEKRLGLKPGEEKPEWLWYLVTEDGQEVPVAMPWNGARRELVKKFLRNEIPASALLEAVETPSEVCQ